MPAQSFSDQEATVFRENARDWLKETFPKDWSARLHGEIAEGELLAIRREWDRLVRTGGYAGLTWPKSVGGGGLGPIEEFIFNEEAAAFHAPDLLNFIGFNLAGPALIAFGTEEQKQRFLPAILKGEELWCEGFSEPDAGSDMANSRTTATREGDEYVIEGQKLWTSIAQIADRCYLLVRTSLDAPRHHNLSVLLFDMRQDGVDIRPIRQITDDYEFNEVYFSGARAKVGERLGEENEGWNLATLAGFRQDRRIFDGQRRYVLIRAVMDQLKECCREMGSTSYEPLNRDLELLRWHVMRCIEMFAEGRNIAKPSSIMKLIWSDLWQRVAEVGLTLTCQNHEAYWRRQFLYTRAITIAGGTVQIQRNVVADRVLGLGR